MGGWGGRWVHGFRTQAHALNLCFDLYCAARVRACCVRTRHRALCVRCVSALRACLSACLPAAAAMHIAAPAAHACKPQLTEQNGVSGFFVRARLQPVARACRVRACCVRALREYAACVVRMPWQCNAHGTQAATDRPNPGFGCVIACSPRPVIVDRVALVTYTYGQAAKELKVELVKWSVGNLPVNPGLTSELPAFVNRSKKQL